MSCASFNVPAGTDLGTYGALGSCYAGYHYDLNFLTIHGKSRFPGLAVWLQDGRRMPVSIPNGCLLIQAGKQIEWFTNGHVRAGMHEVTPLHSLTLRIRLIDFPGKFLVWRILMAVCGARLSAQRPPEQPLTEWQLRADSSGGCPPPSLHT